MIQKLTLDHFVKVHEMLAGYYGGTVPNIMGCTLAYKALRQAAPNMTNEQLDWAVMQAMTRCKFMPRIPDLMEELYERTEENLPKLPDIDPIYADSYQQGIYYRAVSERNKAKASAPFDPCTYKIDREIPGVDAISLPPRKEYRMNGRMKEWFALKQAEEDQLKAEYGIDEIESLGNGQYSIPYEAWAKATTLPSQPTPSLLASVSNAE